MSSRKFSDQKIEAILEEMAAPTPVKVISDKYGVSERTLYRWKKDRGLSPLEQTLPLGKAKALLEDPEVIKSITDHLGDLPDWKRNRVPVRIAELAQSVFGRPGQRRPETVTEELNEARVQLRSFLNRLDKLGEDAWMYADADVLWEESADREHLQDLLMKLDEANELALAAQSAYGKKAGGRYRDPRIGKFITSLAMIYLRVTRKPPRHTTDPETGQPKSDFNHLAEACIQIFYPAELIYRTGIREQMRSIALIDWGAFNDGSEY